MGRGHMANGAVYLTDLCEPDVNCESRRTQTSWQRADTPIHFRGPEDADETILCGEVDGFSTLEVPVTNDEGEVDTLVVHAQRVVEGPGAAWAGPHQRCDALAGPPQSRAAPSTLGTLRGKHPPR